MSLIPVPRVISAAGFVTSLGGGSLSARRVRDAMDEAAASTWRPDDLQAWAGEVIAEATGAEAGWVTAGAAAGMTLAAAACIARTRRRAMDALPDTVGMRRGDHRPARPPQRLRPRVPDRGRPDRRGRLPVDRGGRPDVRMAARGGVLGAHRRGRPTRARRRRRRSAAARLRARRGTRRARDRRRRRRAAAVVEPPPVRRRGRRARRVQRRQGDPRPAGLGHPRRAARADRVGSPADAGHGRRRRGVDRPRGRGAAASRPRAEHEDRQGADRRARRRAAGVRRAATTRPRRPSTRAWLERPAAALSPVAGPGRATDLHFYPRLVVEARRERARAAAGRLAAGVPPIVVPHAPLARGELVRRAGGDHGRRPARTSRRRSRRLRSDLDR